MALAPCYECGRRVSSDTTTCPGCGVESPVSDQSWPNWTRRQFEAGRRREQIEGQLTGSDLPAEEVAALLDKYEEEVGPVEATAKLEDPVVRIYRRMSIGDWHWGKIALVWVSVFIFFVVSGAGEALIIGSLIAIPITWVWVSGREK